MTKNTVRCCFVLLPNIRLQTARVSSSGILLVQRDIRLLALCSQGQTALLQLRLRVIPVLVQNELLQTHKPKTERTHTRDQAVSLFAQKNFRNTRNKKKKSAAVAKLPSLGRSVLLFHSCRDPLHHFYPPFFFALTYLLSP